jgi:TM2 domain-containing membrane protein YozV
MKCLRCNYDGTMINDRCPKCGFNSNDRSFENEMKKYAEEAEILLRKAEEAEKVREAFKSSKREEEIDKSEKLYNVSRIHITYVAKSYSTAVLLWLFLGGFGAHKFYLEKLPQGFGYIVMVAISIVFPQMLIPLIICWIIDICTMREQVDFFNSLLKLKR